MRSDRGWCKRLGRGGVLLFVGVGAVLATTPAAAAHVDANAGAQPRVWADSLTGSLDQPMPGPSVDFRSYGSPAGCAAADGWMERAFWRARRFDTASVSAAGYPPQRATIDSVRACVAHFAVDKVLPSDLLGLGNAYLAAQWPDRAEAAFARRLALDQSRAVAERAWTLTNIVAIYLGQHQPQFDRAMTYMARLDSLGVPAALARTNAHVALAQDAWRRDSVAVQAREAAAALVAVRELAGDTLRDAATNWWSNPMYAYLAEAQAKVRAGDGPGALAGLDAGCNLLVPLTRISPARELCHEWHALIAAIGHPAPPIPAAWRYVSPMHRDAAPGTGKPSIVVVEHNNFEGYGLIRRLAAAYASRGVGITLMVATKGNFGGELVPPDTEALRIRAYYLDSLALPVTLAISRTEWEQRSDGEFMAKLASVQNGYRDFADMDQGELFVIDAKQIIRLVLPLERTHELVIDHVIEELLRSP